MNIIVGCPVHDRAWIIPRWFDHVETACDHAGITDIRYVFVGDPIGDNATAKSIGESADRHDRPAEIDYRAGSREPYERVWGPTRFAEMVDIRNQLLAAVRNYTPSLFWSLDSDILAAADALELGVDALRSNAWGAVGMKAYLTAPPEAGSGNAGKQCPTYAQLSPRGGLIRDDADGCFPTQVIMAAKLMLPTAYHVDYRFHRQGEDIGWCLAARAAGVKIGWDGRTISKHVMTPADLDVIDPRVGF